MDSVALFQRSSQILSFNRCRIHHNTAPIKRTLKLSTSIQVCQTTCTDSKMWQHYFLPLHPVIAATLQIPTLIPDITDFSVNTVLLAWSNLMIVDYKLERLERYGSCIDLRALKGTVIFLSQACYITVILKLGPLLLWVSNIFSGTAFLDSFIHSSLLKMKICRPYTPLALPINSLYSFPNLLILLQLHYNFDSICVHYTNIFHSLT
jgi:hypothetical protein